MPELDEIATPAGAARLFNTSRAKISFWINSGYLETHEIAGGQVVVFVRDVQSLIDSPPQTGRPPNKGG